MFGDKFVVGLSKNKKKIRADPIHPAFPGDDSLEKPIILDLGGINTKFGYCGDDEPSLVIPTVRGLPRHQGVSVGMSGKDSYVGEEALSKRGILRLSCPLTGGNVVNWDDFESILAHIYDIRLHIAPSDYPVVVMHKVGRDKTQCDKETQIFFESLTVPFYYAVPDAPMALHAMNQRSGLVIDSGESTTVSVVENGTPIPSSVFRDVGVGGRLMSQMLYEAQSNIPISFSDEVKEKHCCVALNYEEEIKQEGNDEVFQPQGGESVPVTRERFTVGEVLFNPNEKHNWEGAKKEGIVGLIKQSVASLPDEADWQIPAQPCYLNALPSEVLDRVCKYAPSPIKAQAQDLALVTGGNTKMRGFDARLQKELPDFKFLFPNEADRTILAWKGANKMASQFEDQKKYSWMIAKAEYDEVGPTVYFTKCSN